jgi:hypothetical protein
VKETTFMFSTVLVVVAGIVSLVSAITVPVSMYHYNKWKMLTEGGYSQQMVPGCGYPVWVSRDGTVKK